MFFFFPFFDRPQFVTPEIHKYSLYAYLKFYHLLYIKFNKKIKEKVTQFYLKNKQLFLPGQWHRNDHTDLIKIQEIWLLLENYFTMEITLTNTSVPKTCKVSQKSIKRCVRRNTIWTRMNYLVVVMFEQNICWHL